MKNWFKKLIHRFPLLGKKHRSAVDVIDLSDEEYTAWWGSFLINEQQSRYLKVGSLVFCIDHYNQEWRISCHAEHSADKKTMSSFGVQTKQNEIILTPRLPDRPLIAAVDSPVFIPPGGELTLYASSPAWIRLDIGATSKIQLTEIPTQVLSDTWDGSHLIGELCYAGIKVPLRFEDLDEDSTHIITPLSLINIDDTTWELNQIKLPLPQLSIYHDPQNRLWTETLLVTYEDSIPRIKILPNTNLKQKQLTLLSKPREITKRRFIFFNPFRK
jgi:hypothetical protein